jgi:hypothetical protein
VVGRLIGWIVGRWVGGRVGGQGESVDREILTHCRTCIVIELVNLDLRGWSGKFWASTIDGNNIGKIFFS